MRRDLIVILMTAIVFTLSGCDSSSEQVAVEQTADKAGSHPASHSAKDLEISWFEGSVDEAFAAASAEGKPLFFYWGAVWCPPCQEIKHTVFKSQDFIQLTRLFVPVYLDGDTDSAQTWGEQFGVKGYPTMIVFNTAGEEVTRIPGGIDIERYNGILELSLDQMKPTATLVQIALVEPERLTETQLQQLAYYSWGQDSHAVPEDADTPAMFYRLSEITKDSELAARFYLTYLVSLVSQDSGAPIAMQQGDDPTGKLQAIFDSEQLTVTSWDTLAYWSEEILALPFLSNHSEYGNLWANAVFERRFSDRLSKAEKLAGWLPRLALETRDNKALMPELASQLRAELQQVDNATTDSFERQSIVNQMSYIYQSAGLEQDAKALLLAELGQSASPYYFMSSLGALAESNENFDEAIEWRRKAFESSVGAATRFQWGASYVLALLRMAPLEQERMIEVSDGLLSSFKDSGELFSGRNFRSLRRIYTNLTASMAADSEAVVSFRRAIATLCHLQPIDSQPGRNCQSMLKQDAADPETIQAS